MCVCVCVCVCVFVPDSCNSLCEDLEATEESMVYWYTGETEMCSDCLEQDCKIKFSALMEKFCICAVLYSSH